METTVDARLAQAEADIKALAYSVLKLTKVIDEYRQGQGELVILVGQLLVKIGVK